MVSGWFWYEQEFQSIYLTFFYRNFNLFTQTLNVPSERKVRDDLEFTEYKSEDAHSVVYQEILKQMYFNFRLFAGTFSQNLIGNNETDEIQALTNAIHEFYSKVIEQFFFYLLCSFDAPLIILFLNIFSIFQQ